MSKLFTNTIFIVILSLAALLFAGKFLSAAQVFSLALVAVAALLLAWLLISHRLYRLRAIVAMVCIPLGIPGFKLVADQFGVDVAVEGFGAPAAAIAIVGILVMGGLEWQANHKHIVGDTLKAFSKYLNRLVAGASDEERAQLLDEFESTPGIDSSVFRMVTVVELAYRSRGHMPLTEDIGKEDNDEKKDTDDQLAGSRS